VREGAVQQWLRSLDLDTPFVSSNAVLHRVVISQYAEGRFSHQPLCGLITSLPHGLKGTAAAAPTD
jgi:hypothetical protein